MAITITKPTVNGSNNTWGTTINNALDTVVGAVNGTSGTISPDLSTLTINGTDVTSTAEELNLLDGSVAETVVNNKAVIYGDAGEVAATTLVATTVDLGDWTITQSGTELHFSYDGAVQFKLTSTGTLKANDDVQAEAF